MALLLLIVLQVRDPAPLFRAAVPLLPLAALGLATLLLNLLSWLSRSVASPSGPPERTPRALLAAAVLLIPLGGSMLAQDLQGVSGRFPTGIGAVLPRSTDTTRMMAAWVNARVRPSDLVIVMPAPSWLLQCRTADLLQAVAVSGYGTAFYPDGLRPDRFVYDTHLDASRYLIVDDFTRRWIADPLMFRERRLVERARRLWRRALTLGEYEIYANPYPPISTR